MRYLTIPELLEEHDKACALADEYLSNDKYYACMQFGRAVALRHVYRVITKELLLPSQHEMIYDTVSEKLREVCNV